MDSQDSLNILVKLALQQLIGLDVPKVAHFKCCVILLKRAFTGRNITTSSGWKMWVVWGGKQYRWMLFSLHKLMISIFKCDPCPSRISNLGPGIRFVWGMNNFEIKPQKVRYPFTHYQILNITLHLVHLKHKDQMDKTVTKWYGVAWCSLMPTRMHWQWYDCVFLCFRTHIFRVVH